MMIRVYLNHWPPKERKERVRKSYFLTDEEENECQKLEKKKKSRVYKEKLVSKFLHS